MRVTSIALHFNDHMPGLHVETVLDTVIFLFGVLSKSHKLLGKPYSLKDTFIGILYCLHFLSMVSYI